MIIVVFVFFVIFCFSYILGSINFSILISNLFLKKEVRNFGSGNAGATNMLRTFGKKAAIATFLGDFLKGLVSVWFCQIPAIQFQKFSYTMNMFFETFLIEPQMIALIGVILGHIFPVFYKFRGGKGISTAAGAILAIDYKIFLAVFAVFAIVLLVTKIVSISSVVAVAFFAIINPAYWFVHYSLIGWPSFSISVKIWILIIIQSTLISFIIIYKHKSNINRFLQKKEPKIGN